jgi:hypothetical protein
MTLGTNPDQQQTWLHAIRLTCSSVKVVSLNTISEQTKANIPLQQYSIFCWQEQHRIVFTNNIM